MDPSLHISVCNTPWGVSNDGSSFAQFSHLTSVQFTSQVQVIYFHQVGIQGLFMHKWSHWNNKDSGIIPSDLSTECKTIRDAHEHQLLQSLQLWITLYLTLSTSFDNNFLMLIYIIHSPQTFLFFSSDIWVNWNIAEKIQTCVAFSPNWFNKSKNIIEKMNCDRLKIIRPPSK